MSTTTEATDAPVHYDGAPPSRTLEIAFAAVALAITATYLFLSTQISLRAEAAPGQMDARFWPLVIGTLGVSMAILLLVIAITRPPAGREDIEVRQPGGVVRVILTFAITVAYVVLWSVSSVVAFGYRLELFPIITALYLFVLMLLYGQRKWLGLIIFPVVTTAFIYVLFGILLRIPL